MTGGTLTYDYSADNTLWPVNEQGDKLTNFLLKYSSVWFLLGSIAALLGALAGKKRIRWEVVCMCGITALGMAVWYTMQDAGCWDYKNGLLPGMLWLVGMISVAYHCLTQEER